MHSLLDQNLAAELHRVRAGRTSTTRLTSLRRRATGAVSAGTTEVPPTTEA